jgi:bifunctional non-homologous end joining protein LigD
LTQVDPCIPVLASKPPAGAQGAHEIKHDGYRLTVRLFTRRGYDWTERFPAIAAAAGKLQARRARFSPRSLSIRDRFRVISHLNCSPPR